MSRNVIAMVILIAAAAVSLAVMLPAADSDVPGTEERPYGDTVVFRPSMDDRGMPEIVAEFEKMSEFTQRYES